MQQCYEVLPKPDLVFIAGLLYVFTTDFELRYTTFSAIPIFEPN